MAPMPVTILRTAAAPTEIQVKQRQNVLQSVREGLGLDHGEWALREVGYPGGEAFRDDATWESEGVEHNATIFAKVDFLCRLIGSSYGSGAGQFDYPHGVAIDREGHIVVADYYNDRVQVLCGDGTHVRTIGSSGSGAGQFQNPKGVAIDGEGHIVVADTYNNRVQVLCGDGTHVRTIGSEGSGAGQFREPSGVAIDGEGHIVVADTNNNRVQVLCGDGTHVRTIGSEGSGAGQLKYPHGVAIDGEGHIVVADTNNHRVQVLSADFAVSPAV